MVLPIYLSFDRSHCCLYLTKFDIIVVLLNDLVSRNAFYTCMRRWAYLERVLIRSGMLRSKRPGFVKIDLMVFGKSGTKQQRPNSKAIDHSSCMFWVLETVMTGLISAILKINYETEHNVCTCVPCYKAKTIKKLALSVNGSRPNGMAASRYSKTRSPGESSLSSLEDPTHGLSSSKETLQPLLLMSLGESPSLSSPALLLNKHTLKQNSFAYFSSSRPKEADPNDKNSLPATCRGSSWWVFIKLDSREIGNIVLNNRINPIQEKRNPNTVSTPLLERIPQIIQ